MNPDEPTEAPQRRQSSDARTHDEPLLSTRPEPRRRTAVPALLALCLALVVVAAGVLLAFRLAGQSGPGSSTPSAGNMLVGCWGSGPAFSPALLAGVGTAETEDSAPAQVLRLYLDSAYGQGLPKTGWHRVVATSDHVLFVADASEAGFVEIGVRRGGRGMHSVDGWSDESSGSCKLEPVPAAGYANATWRLDPTFELSPESTELHILATEQECAGGRVVPADSIRADVSYGSSAVTVIVSVVALQGPQTCQGNPDSPYVVKLDQPLGSRALFDGGLWPPAQMAAAGRPIPTSSPTPFPGKPYTVQAGETAESIGARLHFDAAELEWANPGVDLTRIEPGQQIVLPLAHWPTDCGADVSVAGFYKIASMITSFDVYCPVLSSDWSVASSNEGDLGGVSSAPLVEITYKGPNGQSLSLRQGKFGEAAGVSVKRTGPVIGPAKLADRDGTLGGSNASYYIYTAPAGDAMWEMAATGLTQEQFVTLAASLIPVTK